MANRTFLAVDLGAGSGRVVAGVLSENEARLEELHRFENLPRHVEGHDRWDVEALFAGICEGLRRAPSDAISVGVDTWGVDYALLDSMGHRIAEPVCYRDPRTDGSIEAVQTRVPRQRLFESTGIQTQPFNTVYQLWAQVQAGDWPDHAGKLVMMPDLFHQLLCGSTSGEVTNASTTQLLDARSRCWDRSLLTELSLQQVSDVLPELVVPGTRLGEMRPELVERLGCPRLQVIAPATHDTASAVVGTPLEPGQAYLSSGTWSLLGVELDAPLMTGEVEACNLTNEAGAYGTTRLLKNIMGLWIVESMRAAWRVDWEGLLREVDEAPALAAVIDPNDPRFLNPNDMVATVRAYLSETGQRVPSDRGTLARVVLESLAASYAVAIAEIERCTGSSVDALRIIGGGAKNRFLNQQTANAIDRPVLAGPTEATALGNVLVQAVSSGQFENLAAARTWMRSKLPVHEHVPCRDTKWDKHLAHLTRLSTPAR